TRAERAVGDAARRPGSVAHPYRPRSRRFLSAHAPAGAPRAVDPGSVGVMRPSRLPGAMNSGCGHGVPAAAVIFLAFCAVLAGCETAPAPVSERRVEEYRKPPPAPPLK